MSPSSRCSSVSFCFSRCSRSSRVTGEEFGEAPAPVDASLPRRRARARCRGLRLDGNGERSLPEMTAPLGYGQLRQALELASYTVGRVNLSKSGEVPSGADLVIVAGPKADVLDAEAEALERYLATGGHLMM